MDKFEVENKAEYVPAWISYLSIATGILRSLGEEVDLAYTGGYTGYAFHLNTAKGDTCPSAPTVAPFESFREGLESFGWRILFGWTGPDYVPSEDEKEIERARGYFEDVKATLSRTNRPVGIWGIPVPEFGIVNGFNGDNYVVSTFRSLQSESREETPIRFNQLIAPGGLSKMAFEEKIDLPNQKILDKEALQRALTIAKGVDFGNEEINSKYVTGPDALSEWAETIEKGKVPESEEHSKHFEGESQINYHGNSYVAACTQEGMTLASSFLMRLSRRYKSESFSHDLAEASHRYKHAAEKMIEYTELFPFSLELNWKEEEFTSEKRSKGSQLLRDTRPHLLEAIEHMETALNTWSI